MSTSSWVLASKSWTPHTTSGPPSSSWQWAAKSSVNGRSRRQAISPLFASMPATVSFFLLSAAETTRPPEATESTDMNPPIVDIVAPLASAI
jgi:hypothetical protein